MVTNYITFRSVTFAQRGERVLRQAGVSCQLLRTPRWMEEQGCGYCLILPVKEVQRAVSLLRGQQVPYRKVYQRLDGGTIEETEL